MTNDGYQCVACSSGGPPCYGASMNRQLRLAAVLLSAGLTLVPSCSDRAESTSARPSPATPSLSMQPSVTTPRSDDGLPAGVLPVTLARVEASAQRNVQGAEALVFVDLSGALSLGRISHGLSPYQVLPRDQAAALRAQLFAPSAAVGATAPAQPQTDAGLPVTDLIMPAPVPPALAFATFEVAAAPFDTLILADASVGANHVVDVLTQLRPKRTAIAVAAVGRDPDAGSAGSAGNGAAPAAMQFTFGPPAVSPLPVHIFVVLDDDSFAINVLDAQTPPTLRAAHQAAFDRAELSAALRVAIATVPAGRVQLDFSPTITLQRWIDALTAIAAAGAHHVQVASVDTTLGGPLDGGNWSHGGGRYSNDGSRTGYANLRPAVKIGTITVNGALEKAIVRRYMKRNFNRFSTATKNNCCKNQSWPAASLQRTWSRWLARSRQPTPLASTKRSPRAWCARFSQCNSRR